PRSVSQGISPRNETLQRALAPNRVSLMKLRRFKDSLHQCLSVGCPWSIRQSREPRCFRVRNTNPETPKPRIGGVALRWAAPSTGRSLKLCPADQKKSLNWACPTLGLLPWQGTPGWLLSPKPESPTFVSTQAPGAIRLSTLKNCMPSSPRYRSPKKNLFVSE